MPRLDLQYRNCDIAHMLRGLRQQARALADEISYLETRVELLDRDELFKDVQTRDRMTSVSLAADNLSAEATTIWKRTR